ncbi:MAG: hypothetical protein AAFY34_11320 [Pseudomonadota bacterium]
MARYSLWLLLPPEAERAFRVAKRTADKALKGDDFQPHLTVAGAFETSLEHFRRICVDAIHTSEPASAGWSVAPSDYELGETYFQSLYVRCNVSQGVRFIRQSVFQALGVPDTDFIPHISLYYGKADAEARRKILPELPRPIGTFQTRQFSIAGEGDKPMSWEIVLELPTM